MKKIGLVILTNCFLFISVFAQVSGKINDQQGKALSNSTVSLRNAKDSSIVKLAASDNDGNFSIPVNKAGHYIIGVTHVGYTQTFSQPFEVSGSGDVKIPDLQLNKETNQMKEVVVSSKKPMIEVRADKTIVNVEGTINAIGNDALELLRRSPGVIIDKDDNITLAGKNGVQIYIDGKQTPLTASDLSAFLKSLQSAQIESIEIITNPSAKYEAAGNAGIINIRLKKSKAFGTNGSVNLGYVQGVYPKANGGLNFNHRNKNINIFGNYNYNYGTNLMKISLESVKFDTLFQQYNSIRFKNNTHSYKAGVDYFLDKKSTIGAMVSGNIANNDFNTAGPMYFTYLPTGQLDHILKATNNNEMKRDNANANLNYRYSVSGGTELNVDADYGYYRIRSNQFQPNYYFQPDGSTEISRSVYNMIAPSDIDIYSLKADYERNFKGGRLGVGGKVGAVNTDNDFQRYNVYGSDKILDTLKSNRFQYKENINALYVNYNKQFKKGYMLQFGLRAENTHSNGHSTGFNKSGSDYLPYDSSFIRDYTDFFPSASVTLNKNPMKQWTFTYSRRIDRPAYQDLNPFEFKLNEYTYMKGNTQLRPQYTNSFGVTNIYKYKLTTTLNYSHVKDIFAQVPDTIERTKGYLTKRNLATQDVVSLSVTYPVQIKWYTAYLILNSNYSNYKADFGGGNRNIDQSVFSLVYVMQNSFKLGKGWTGELNGLYISPSVWQGVIRSNAMGSVDVGLQKLLMQGKLNLKAAVTDVFSTMKWGGYTDFTGFHTTVSGHGEMPLFKLTATWRFGSNEVKAARQRKSGIDDESKRTNSSNGQGPQQKP
jgi:outer membrane beta-barrel protein/carboxypeptidase family protein